MPNLRDCITRAVNGGAMDPVRAQRVLSEYDGTFEALRQNMGHTQAEAEAARMVVQKVKAEAKEKRRVQQLQAAVVQRQAQRLQAHTNIRGEVSPGDYLQDMISNKRGAKGSTLAGKYEAVRRGFRREMTDAMQAFKANLIGQRRNKETLRNMAREVFGDDTGDEAAKRMAQAWAKVSERARTRFNSAGGHIGKRADWGLPQMHSTRAVRKAGYETWRGEILPRLDLDAMGRDFNNGVPFTPESLEILLKDAFEAIRTDGYSRRSPAARHGSAMYNRRADHRFFKFKSADDWMDYNERFGSGRDPFRVMLGHLDNMAMDISMMEELGPNPMNTFSYLKDAAASLAARSGEEKSLEVTRAKTRQADHMFDLFTGKANVPDNPNVAAGFSALRQYLTSAHLGSAVWSSVTDFNSQRVAAGFVGMDKLGFMKQMRRLIASKDFREEAQNAGLIFENAVDQGNAVARYDMEDIHIETAARLADFTIRSSGLGYLTEIQRQSFGMEFMNTVARKWRGQTFDQLEPKTQRMMESYGIQARDWDVIRSADVHETRNGMQMVRAQEIEERGFQDVADRYMEMITSLTEFAVPSTDLYGRAFVLGRTTPGSLSGEFLRSALQFKAFPVTMMTTQVSRVMAELYEGRKLTAAQYAAGLLIGNTLLGALAIQMKDTTKGRDPRDMTSSKFWMAAVAQGGGAGIFGDFLFADVNRFGGSLGATLAGPTIGFADDVLKYTVGNVQELAQGEDTKFGRETVNMLRRYTPGGSLWYLRLAYEREVLDRVQEIVDPKAAASFKAKVRGAKQFDTEFFVQPGKGLFDRSSRAPNLNNMIGG